MLVLPLSTIYSAIKKPPPEEEIKGLIENILSGESKNDDILLDNLFLMGALAYKNYCIEDNKFGLMALQERINKQIEDL